MTAVVVFRFDELLRTLKGSDLRKIHGVLGDVDNSTYSLPYLREIIDISPESIIALFEAAAPKRFTTNSHWIHVPNDVVNWLDANGLIIEQMNASGRSADPNTFHRPGRSMFAALWADVNGVAPQGETVTVPVDPSAVPMDHYVEQLVEGTIEGLRRRLQDFNPGALADMEDDLVSGVKVKGESDGVMNTEPAPDAPDNSVDLSFVGEQRSVSVDDEPGHRSSP